MPHAIVLGGSGSLGSACVTALRTAGWDARAEPAPRLRTTARDAPGILAAAVEHGQVTDRLVRLLTGVDLVVNAAGMPTITAGASDALFGANALLPGLLADAANRAGVPRMVHLSSVSVQDRSDPLDETLTHRPASPYALSRAVGETVVDGLGGDAAVILRLPSVLGSDTAGQRALERLARTPLSSVAGRTARPRPMAMPENVAAAVVFLAARPGPVPRVVLQPADGLTTVRVLELLGDGRRPRRLPVPFARAVSGTLLAAGRWSPRVRDLGRGLELMWLGQRQVTGWLTRAGFVPPVDGGRRQGPLKVGVLSHWYAPELGPNPAPTAERLAERGHDVKVLTGFPNYPTGRVYEGYRQRFGHRERIRGVDVRRVPLYASHDTSGVRRAANFLSFALTSSLASRHLADRDVVYVYASPLTAAAAALALRRRGVPYVLHVIDLWPDSVVESGMVGGRLARRAVGALLGAGARALYARAEHVIALTPGMRQVLIDRGVPAAKVTVVYNWAPHEQAARPEPDPALRARLGRPGRTLAVFAGNVGQMQDVATIVRAAALCQDDTPLDVAIVGAGTAFAAAEDLAEELGAKNVRFLPRVDSSEMPAVYAVSDYQLVTLKDRPLFGVTVPSKMGDALAAGCAVITNVRGDAAAMCAEGGFGIACAPESPEALAEAFRQACSEDEATRSSRRERAVGFYRRTLSMRAALDRLDTIFDSATGRPR